MPHSSVALVSYDSLARATNQWAQQLGSGSYGNVYAGVLHGERVAVKRFRAKCSDGAVDSFLRECAVAAQVQHANLLRVVAMAVDHETHLCLAYPLLEGGSLWDRLVSRTAPPLSASQRALVALCAARGLAAMHAQRQVHHDVKSGNVLLSAGHCSCVLADTGSSYALPAGVDSLRETPPLENLNYPCWAPEFVAEGLVRPACDVYSLGVLLCELLSSKPATMPRLATDGVVAMLRPALEAGTPEAVADAQARWPPPLLRALGGIAARCLCVDGSRRPTSAAVAAELERACVAAGLGSPQAVCGASALPEQAATPVGQPALARLPSGADEVQAVSSRGRARRALAPAATRAATEQEGPPAKRLRSSKAAAHQLAAAPASCEEEASPSGGCAVAQLLVEALLCGAHSQRLKACQSLASLAAALPAAVDHLLAAGVVPPLVTLLSRARRGERGCHLAAAAASSLGFLVGPPGITPNRGAQDAAGRSGAVAFLLAALQAPCGEGGADGQTEEEEEEGEGEGEGDDSDGAAQPPSSSQQHSGFSGSEGHSGLSRACALPPPVFAATLLALLEQHEENQQRAMEQDAAETMMGVVGRARDAALTGPFDAGSQGTAKLIPYAVKCLHVLLRPLIADTWHTNGILRSFLSLGLSLCNAELPRTAALAGAHLVQATLAHRPRLSDGALKALSVGRTLGGLARAAHAWPDVADAAAAALGELGPAEITAVLSADPRLSAALVAALSPDRSAPLPLLSVLACGGVSSDVQAQPGQLAAAVAARAALLSAAPLLVAALRAGEPARTRSADALEALVRSGPDAALTVARAWAVAPLAGLERQTGLGRAQVAASEVLDCLASHPGLASEVARARAGAALTVPTAVAPLAEPEWRNSRRL